MDDYYSEEWEKMIAIKNLTVETLNCLLYTSPSPRD